ncbi:MAG: hypothetical protein ACLTUE_05870 [Oscillospiraceae bacterium]
MEDKRAQYGEDEIITLEFDDGVTFDCGMMGTFELDGKEYIALEARMIPTTSISTAISATTPISICSTSPRKNSTASRQNSTV